MLLRIQIAAIIASGLTISVVQGESINLKLIMPGTIFRPGQPCWLNLNVANTGEALTGAELYVALMIGAEQIWFYPSWNRYPPDLDCEVIDLGQTTVTLPILSEFSWPSGNGEFTGAIFYAAIMYGGNLVSNLAEYTFGWTEISQTTPGSVYSIDVIIGNMRYVPAGTFTQGSSDDEPCRMLDESLFIHCLTQNIAVMETEVTRQMWLNLKEVQPSLPVDPSLPDENPTLAHPVEGLTWFECLLFANLLSLQNGFSPCYFIDAAFTIPIDSSNYRGPMTKQFFSNFYSNGYRLPSEGEWEYFCRAGTTTPFSCNEPNYSYESCDSCSAGLEPILDQYCVYCQDTSAQVTGSKLPNPWNLRDVHGNMWEWCWDWYETYPSSSQINYTGPATGTRRVLRGGCWSAYSFYCRSAYREINTPGPHHSGRNGFRLVRSLP